MRTIEDIIEDAQRMVAETLREAFAVGGSEAAVEIRARAEALFEPIAEPVRYLPRRAETPRAAGEPAHRQSQRQPAGKPSMRAILLGAAALLTLALAHARAARILPACALLLGLGALLQNWSDENGEPE